MKPRMQRPFTATPRRQRGAVIVLIVIALASMLLMGALALDGGHMLLNKTRLQNAVDAAALSGAKTLSQVYGTGNASTLSRDAALDTLAKNANADGNGELATAITAAGGVDAFAVVELSSSVYGPFAFPWTGPPDARYVRVSVLNYCLAGFFWSFAQSFGVQSFGDCDPGEKAVAAIATAAPSSIHTSCELAPLMVCGETVAGPGGPESPDGTFWGYQLGDLEVLKSAAGNDPEIGPGNFQLIRLGDSTGGDDIRDALAEGIDECSSLGEEVETEPGNTVGPVAQGLNTRFGQYSGPISPGDYPPDWVTTYTGDTGGPVMTYNDTTLKVQYNSEDVSSNNGDLSTASGTPLYDLNNWREDSSACTSSTCDGAPDRRMLNIVIGNCDGASGGQTSVPVLGHGCFFLVQPVSQQGNQAQIFGQFDTNCPGEGYGPAPIAEGPQIIQLYKTYLDCGPDAERCPPPSPDS